MPRRIQRTSITNFLGRLPWSTCFAIAAAMWLVFHMFAVWGEHKPGPLPQPGHLGPALVLILIGGFCKSAQWIGPAVFLFFRFVGWIEGAIERKLE